MTQIPNITAQQTEHNVGQQQKRLWAPEERLSLQDRESSLKQREWPPPQTPPRPPPHIFSHTMTNQMLPFRAQVTCSLTLTPPLPPSLPPPAGCWDAECCGCTIWNFDKWLSLRTEPPPSQECWWLTGLLEDPPFSHAACCSSAAQTMPLTSFTFCRFQTDFQPLKYYSESSAASRSLGE